MNGQKYYEEAEDVTRKINEYPTQLSSQKKHALYFKSFELIKRSAYLGHPKAQYDYAQQFDSMSFLGIENPLFNPKKCIYWYTKSANNGYAEAFNNLSDFYERGEGVEKDLKKAYELLKRGVELGSKLAKSNLKIFDRDIKKGKYKLD